jgi:hypothetical protein
MKMALGFMTTVLCMVAPNMTVCLTHFMWVMVHWFFSACYIVGFIFYVILSGILGEGSRRGQFPFGLPTLYTTFPIVFSPHSTTIFHTLVILQ